MSARPRLRVAARPLHEVVAWLRAALVEAEAVDLVVVDPDASPPRWPGARLEGGAPYRGWRAWVDLAAELGCVLGTPRPAGPGEVRCTLRRAGGEAPWHRDATGDARERYADPAGFDAVEKLEDPGFALPLIEGLTRLRPPDGGRVLVLGCHRGDEIAALGLLDPPPRGLDVVGVDHAAGPLARARERFPDATFVEADVGSLPPALGHFDLVIAIAVLQSRGVDDRAVLRRLAQDHVGDPGALLLGVPASRFRGFDVVWGARTRNYREVDLSLVVDDLATYRRYLHQHRFRTHVGGRYDLLLSAWRGRPAGGTSSVGPARPR